MKPFQLPESRDPMFKVIFQELHESMLEGEGGWGGGGALVFDDAQLSSRLPDVQFASDAGVEVSGSATDPGPDEGTETPQKS
jgi:hypothetical protein